MYRKTTIACACCALIAFVSLWLPKTVPGTKSQAARPVMQTASPTPVIPLSKASEIVKAEPAALPDPRSLPAFNEWVHRYQLANPAERAEMVPEGELLARQRQGVLYDLIKNDPRAALDNALASPARRMLPATVGRWLEEHVSARGELATVAAAPIPGMAHLITRPIFREARIGDKSYEAFVYGQRAKQETKYGTSLFGIVVNDRMAVLDETVQVLPRSSLAPEIKLEPGIAMESHAAPSSVEPGTPVLQTQGRAYPVCCAAHAAAFAAQVNAAETQAGPFVEAFGGSVANSGAVPSAASASTGPTNVLVIIADFSDAPGTPIDQSTSPVVTPINSAYVGMRVGTEVSDFLSQASYGKVSISSVSVTSVLRMPATLASYASGNQSAKLKNDAVAAAAAYGPASFAHVAVVFHSSNGVAGNKFTWSGLADLGGNFLWYNGYFSLSIVSHELCHNYGMRHANLWEIPNGSTDPVDPAGTSVEYGDPFDVMGSGPGNSATQADFPSPWALNRVHWLADTAVQTITTSGTYRVYRYDHKDAVQTNTLALKLGRNFNSDYWVGYRRKYAGHPDLGDVANGAYITWGYHDNLQSNLIDIDTPGNDSTDASLNVGNTFNDTAAGISFSVTANGGSGTAEYLDVQVNFQPRISFTVPSVSVDEQAGTLAMVVQRQSNSTGVVSVNYATANGTAIAGSDYTAVSGTLTWASGDMTSRTINIPIVGDAVKEGAEVFTLNLSGISGGVTPDGTAATITIQESGDKDAGFTPTFLSSAVRAVIVQPDNKLVIGGYFTASGDVVSGGVTRLEANGVVDPVFDDGVGVDIPGGFGSSQVYTLARQQDGKILVGGIFSSLRSTACTRIARLNVDGTFDLSFSTGTGPNGAVNVIKIQPDGKLLVGGTFSTWNGTAHAGLVRLNDDGSVDASFADFNAVVDPPGGGSIIVNDIALQPVAASPSFRVLVVGHFARPFSGGGFHSGVVALNAANGSRDTSFDVVYGAHVAGANNNLTPVASITLQPDGKIVVGGQFTGFNNATVGRIVRLTNAGANDSTLAGGVTGSGFVEVSDLLIQGDGKINACGTFSTAGGSAQQVLARFTSAGAFDSGFRPAITMTGSLLGGWCMALQSDSRIVAGLNGSATDGLGASNVMKRFFSSLPQTPSIVAFASDNGTAAEGTSAGVFVQRSGGSLGAISVNYATVAGTATAGSDYTTTTGTLTWADGDSAAKQITVPLLTDALGGEGDETFEIRLGAPVGGFVLGAAQTAVITITNTDSSSIPHVEFAAAGSTVNEDGVPASITVNIAPVPVTAFTVPIIVSGTASQGPDYTLNTATLNVAAGESFKTITLTPVQDALLEASETAVLTLGTPAGNAMLGGQTVHTATIADDEKSPSFNPGGQPVPRIAALGAASVIFNASASGNPLPTYQWRKVTTAIKGQTSDSYTINTLQLVHGGSYNVQAINKFGTLSSTAAELGVLDKFDKTVNGVAGGKVALAVGCSANITGFRWYHNNVPMSDITGHVAGALTKTLTITKLANSSAVPLVLTDDGEYKCEVTMPTATLGPLTTFTGITTLKVIDTKPDITNSFTLPDAVVGGAYNVDVPYAGAQNLTPTSFSAAPLPTGITINAATGKISGRPIVAITADTVYHVVIKATNAIGYDTLTTDLTLRALPAGTVGVFAGPVLRSGDINGNLGGRVDITTAAGGSFTGKLVNGTSIYPLSGLLTATVGNKFPTGICGVTRPVGLLPLTVTFTIDADNDKLSSLSITDGPHTVTGEAWRNVVPAASYQDVHTFYMTLDVPNSALPQGPSYGSYTVAPTGKLTVAGKLADGVAFTTAGHVSKTGEVLIHQVSATADTIVGKVKSQPGVLADFSDYTLNGAVTWSRKVQAAASHTFHDAFGPVGLTAVGARYRKPPLTEAAMGMAYTAGVTLKNGRVSFTGADFSTPSKAPDADVLVKPGGVGVALADSDNTRTTTFAITPSTGFFTGIITLVDHNPVSGKDETRKATYQGLVVRDLLGLNGHGFVLLPKIPSVPGETLANTTVESATVLVEKAP